MGIFYSTAFSKVRKSFGNLTVCRLHGQNIVKEKMTEVTNPRTPAQQMQRERMKTLVGLCNTFDPAIMLGFPKRPIKETPYNTFVRLNAGAVEVSEDLTATVHYEQLVCSTGNRTLPEISVASDAEKRELTFTYEAGEFSNHAAPTDLLYAVGLEKEKNRTKVFPLGSRSETEPVVISLPEGWEVANLAVYVFVLSKDKHQASATRYLEIE